MRYSEAKEKKGGFATSVLYAAIIGLAVSVVLPFILSGLIMLLNMSDTAIPWAGRLSAAIGALTAGLFYARRAGRSGLFGGFLTSLVFFALLYCVGFLATGTPGQGAAVAINMSLAVAFATLGGVMGVNMRR